MSDIRTIVTSPQMVHLAADSYDVGVVEVDGQCSCVTRNPASGAVKVIVDVGVGS